jgi:hypothetical protein
MRENFGSGSGFILRARVKFRLYTLGSGFLGPECIFSKLGLVIRIGLLLNKQKTSDPQV